MLRFMYSGISGMKVNQNKLDVVGNNISNVSTTAFKASSARFTDMLYQNMETASAPSASKGGTNAKQVGLGSKLSSINRIMSQGNMIATGRTFDVGIDGEGYLIVATGEPDYSAAGGINLNTDQSIIGGNMKISYTRDGNLTRDYEGNLLTADGHRVMGYLLTAKTYGTDGKTEIEPKSAASSIDANGKAHFVNAEGVIKAVSDTKLQPLKIPEKVHRQEYTDSKGNTIKEHDEEVTSITINKSDGLIIAGLEDGSRTVLGQIALANFTNPEGLTAIGGNFYESSPNSGTEVVRTAINIDKDDKGKPKETAKQDNSKAFGDINQGCLEASNVDLTEQFTNMIEATRSFQASAKLITTGDEILQTVTGLLR